MLKYKYNVKKYDISFVSKYWSLSTVCIKSMNERALPVIQCCSVVTVGCTDFAFLVRVNLNFLSFFV